MKPERAALLKLLAELSEIHPDMRLGQLVTNLAGWAKGPIIVPAYDVTDGEMIEVARTHIQEHRARLS